MRNVTTARILAERALERPCGQECVDWAVSMLEQGQSGQSLATLAGMTAPFNHFELAALRDRALRELGIGDVEKATAARLYAAECLRSALDAQEEMVHTLQVVRDLCVALNYPRDLFDFYLLYYAYCDLTDSGTQHYWPGATRENVLSIIKERAETFIREAPRLSLCSSATP